jgi:hypothetical protein
MSRFIRGKFWYQAVKRASPQLDLRLVVSESELPEARTISVLVSVMEVS